jgi:hypothetical protein
VQGDATPEMTKASPCAQAPELFQLHRRRVVAREAGGMFELDDDWVQGGILVVL